FFFKICKFKTFSGQLRKRADPARPVCGPKIALSRPDPVGSDEDFPADCSLLFEKQAAQYLDMECLAMIGMVLAQLLAGKDNPDMAKLA
ncbi:MAG: DUF3786 domain-containing protein, partial [Desulfotignum balticum]|nr:DUF3786 domain-containing protein [Desulfotignum balticum]